MTIEGNNSRYPENGKDAQKLKLLIGFAVIPLIIGLGALITIISTAK